MFVDYRRWKPGVALSAKIVLTQCPLRGESCHEKETKRGFRFVHEVTIEKRIGKKSKTSRMATKVNMACKQTVVEHHSRPTYPGAQASA